MNAFSDTTLIVLGAGLSTRFGSDKLSSDFCGRPLATHLLVATAPFRFAQKILIARGQPWTADFAAAGYDIVTNSTPERGQSSSLKLGLARASAQNVLVMLADMPLVSAEHLRGIESVFMAGNGTPVASSNEERRCPPAMFRRSEIAFARLEGDSGARDLLALAAIVQGRPGELSDVDSLADLAALQVLNKP